MSSCFLFCFCGGSAWTSEVYKTFCKGFNSCHYCILPVDQILFVPIVLQQELRWSVLSGKEKPNWPNSVQEKLPRPPAPIFQLFIPFPALFALFILCASVGSHQLGVIASFSWSHFPGILWCRHISHISLSDYNESKLHQMSLYVCLSIKWANQTLFVYLPFAFFDLGRKLQTDTRHARPSRKLPEVFTSGCVRRNLMTFPGCSQVWRCWRFTRRGAENSLWPTSVRQHDCKLPIGSLHSCRNYHPNFSTCTKWSKCQQF